MAVTYQQKTVYLEPGSYAGSRTVTIKADGPLSLLFGHKRCLGKMCSHNSIRKAMPAPADIGFLPKRVCELLLTSLPRRCLCGLPLFSAMKKARSAATTRSSLGLVLRRCSFHSYVCANLDGVFACREQANAPDCKAG